MKKILNNPPVSEVLSENTPPTGYRKLFPKSDGWYDIDSNGIEKKIGGNEKYPPITISWDGQGGYLSQGNTRYFVMPYSATIKGWSIVAEGNSPNCTIDIWKISSGTSLPTAINSIVPFSKPTLNLGNVVRSSNVSDWQTSILEGDIIGFNIHSVVGALTIKINIEID
jgi:hypothetical protein